MSCISVIIDQRPATVPYYIKEGDDFLKSFEFFDADDNPIDMSGVGDVDFYVDNVSVATLGAGMIVSGDDNNVITLGAQNTYTAGSYTYAIKVVDGEGFTQTYIDGKLKVIA